MTGLISLSVSLLLAASGLLCLDATLADLFGFFLDWFDQYPYIYYSFPRHYYDTPAALIGAGLSAGAWIEVRSKEEILHSLDANGRLGGLPFMPQMFEFCGRRFRIYKSAHKTCDTVNGTGGRRLTDGIHLENVRCDGQAYGGCEAACLIFWKTAWLKPVEGPFSSGDVKESCFHGGASISEQDVLACTLAPEQPTSGGPKYSCQATDLPTFTEPLPWWDARQYAQDYMSGNRSLGRLIAGCIYSSYYYLSRPGRVRLRLLGILFQWLYDRITSVWGGVPFPRRSGMIQLGQPTPIITLDLQPGELVRVKSYEDILATIDEHNKNRGLFFDAEMVPYCGRTFRVRSRVSRFVSEQTGRIVTLKTPAVILENVWCQSSYSDRRMHCPRSIYSWWREVWLERVVEPTPERGGDDRMKGNPVRAESTISTL
jgi:hypothetical protein